MHTLKNDEVQLATDINNIDMAQFLSSILPTEGVLFAASPKDIGWHHRPCSDVAMLAKECSQISKAGKNSYFAMASYNEAKYFCESKQKFRSRTQENVRFIRSMWIDIDCGPLKPFATIDEALSALDEWQEKLNLPGPTFLVSSGNGLHIYWTFNEDIRLDEWEPVAQKFADLQKQYSLKSDNISGNAACLLRPIGTNNYKDPLNPKLVKLLSVGPTQNFSDWTAAISNSAPVLLVTPKNIKSKSKSSIVDAVLDYRLDDYPPSDPELMADECQFFHAMRASLGADQSEPEWFSALGVLAKMKNGPEISHYWSSGHAGYNFLETQRKLGQWDSIGPTTCERIKAVSISCVGCKQKCKSPIQLGQPKSNSPAVYPNVISDKKIAALFTMPPGDILAARYFARLNEGKYIYVPQYGEWFLWDGNFWKQDSHRAMEAAKSASDKFLQDTTELFKTDPDRFKPYLNFASQLRNKGRLDNMLALAASERAMSVESTNLDKDIFLLGVPNGIVDLRRAKLLPPSAGQYITKQAGCIYDPDAQCPDWLAFLDSVFQGDESIIRFIQLALGYTLTGSNTEERIFILYGNGANGKSVFGNVIAHVMGSYGITGDSSVLVNQKPEIGPSSEMARYAGARYVSFNETASGNKLDARAVKILAGREPIVARHLYQKAFVFSPQFSPWLRTNHKPIITDTDDGLWRRVILIPFKASFTGANNDPHIERRLLNEIVGILRWIVDGAKLCISSGLEVPAIISDEVKSYRSDSDLFGQFLGDKTRQKPGVKIEQSLLWVSYTVWCHSENIHPGTKTSFTRRLAESGFPATKSNGKRYYQGLELVQGE